MRLEQLRQFIAVAQTGNFRKASKELGISQPALTRSIQNLEQYFNVPLFDRLSSGVILTYYGRSVMEWAEETVASSRNIKRYVDLLSKASTGTLVVGTGSYFMDNILAIALSRFLQRYPKLTIRVIKTSGRNAENMLLNHEIDIFLGLIDGTLKTEEIFVKTFETGPVIIFCRKSHPLLKISGPDLAVVLKYPFVGPIVPEEVRVQVNRFRYELTGENRPFIDIEFDSYAQIRKLVELSNCVGGLPESIMNPYLKDGLFVRLPVSLPDISHTTSISYLKERTLLPATILIVEELTKIVQGKSREIRPGEPA
jgi:DNA-binding transcriptional LysR family regulator